MTRFTRLIAIFLSVFAPAFAACGGSGGYITYACDGLGLTSLKYQGVEYFDMAGYARAIPITYGATFSDGTQPGNGSQAATSGATYSSVSFASNTAYSYQVRFDYSIPDTSTLKIVVTITNNNSSASINGFTSFVPVSLDFLKPYTTVQPGNTSPINGSFGTYVITPAASIAYFSSNFSDNWYALDQNIYANQPNSSYDRWNLGLSNTQTNGPTTLSTPIPPSSSKVLNLFIRFGPTTANESTMDAEALAALNSTFPNEVSAWPDRRPIATWFLSDYGHASGTNPRGWFNDPTCNCTNQATFHSRIQQAFNQLLGVVNAQPVKPQAVVLWDMEGQEFPQVMTYVGNPPLLMDLAPEMNAEIDSVMAALRANGYRVGMTLRPSHFLYGMSLPSSCNYNSNPDYTDRFLLVNGTPSSRYYLCNSSQVLVNYGGIGDQTSYTDVASIVAELANKVSYANTRWGATVFYVDSTVWSGGAPLLPAVWQQLQAMFPNCLFMPEESTDATYAYAAPYHDAHQGNFWSSGSHRFLYPAAFGAINLGNTVQTELPAGFANVQGTTLTQVAGAPFVTTGAWNGQTIYVEGVALQVRSVASTTQLTLSGSLPTATNIPWRISGLTDSVVSGMAYGDVYLYPGWFSEWHQAATAALFQEAQYTVPISDTSSGSVLPISQSPGSAYVIPLKMQVWLASTAAALNAATSGITVCRPGASCVVNLNTTPYYQVRYFDLAGNLVATTNPSTLAPPSNPISVPAATPAFSPVAGTYSATQNVTITTTTPGATIRYTTDGSTPSETNGAIYTTAVSASGTTAIKAIAYETGYADSAVASAAFTINSGTGSVSNWYNSAWAYRKTITISHTHVSGSSNLTNFPVLVSLAADANLSTSAQSTGNDILFAASNGTTKLNHEIELYTSSTGQLIAWVQVPSVSPTTDTVIYMYYGNNTAGNQQNAGAVWDGNYKAVYHLGSFGSGGMTVNDSTSNRYNLAAQGDTIIGTPYGSSPSVGVGRIGRGINFPGNNQYRGGDALGSGKVGLVSNAVTISGWINLNSIYTGDASGLGLFGVENPGTFDLYYDNSAKLNWQIQDVYGHTRTVTYSTALAASAWYFIAGVYDGSSTVLYVNGNVAASSAASPFTVSDGTFKLNRVAYANVNRFGNFIADEVRVSATNRSGAWIATEYNNQLAPSSFYSVSAQQTH